MEPMSVTLAVLKPLTSRLVKLLQPQNMATMLVTSLVFRLLMPVMDRRLFIPSNHERAVVGRAAANDELKTTLVTLA